MSMADVDGRLMLGRVWAVAIVGMLCLTSLALVPAKRVGLKQIPVVVYT